ncbi:MAG: VCBS repeat-containing protein [Myxococcales bacterium]|nr:VCBS repeat-containing protein [Myxococcales bacterium]
MLLSSVLLFSMAIGACRSRPDASGRPVPSVSAVPSESASMKAVEVEVGDLVEIAAAAPLSAAPGASVNANAESSAALVIGRGSGAYHRVLLSDGSSGWTTTPLTKLASTRVHPRVNLELQRFVRFDPRRMDPDGPSTVSLPAGGVASVIGASLEGDAPSERALRLAEAPFLEQPQLMLRLGPTVTGFVHGLTMDLEWIPTPSIVPSALRGIVRHPFLGPFAAAAIASAPRVGEMTHVVVETTLDFDTFRALPTPLHHWASVETLVRDPAPKPGGIESLAVVGDGGAFAFVFAGKDKRESFVRPRADLGSPWLTRVVLADLDGDGLAEWLVEVVESTAHSRSVRLIVVAGSSLAKGFSGSVIHLGGEPESDPTERYAWYVEGSHLFAARDLDVRAQCHSMSMTSSGLVLDSPPPKIVWTKLYGAAAPARADARSSNDGRHALPIVVGGKPRWTAGRCFRDPAEAAKWATSVGGHVL